MKVAWILALFAATAMAIPAEAAENEVEQSMPEVESPLDDEQWRRCNIGRRCRTNRQCGRTRGCHCRRYPRQRFGRCQTRWRGGEEEEEEDE